MTREDAAEKAARIGLANYGKPVPLPDKKACGCPLVGCTVACRKQSAGECPCPLGAYEPHAPHKLANL